MLLIDSLIRRMTVIDRPLERGQTADEAMATKVIDEETNARRQAVVDAINFYYKRLDKLTSHGARFLPEREKFFADLFTPESLAEMNFPYMKEAKIAAGTPVYRKAKPVNLPAPGAKAAAP
ncbi:MAG: hypothetical protein ACRD9W_17930, partial [Terriglobia bacterium]